ncbi:unnamed protein product [Nyctereutes procyonoides]|uniref:(raccoon dog) hypothetical protein n=1 Tax=Nyctereutes procyonoides TaxID=34880 RepID=A0A811ZTU2_NYCPR|nr:unnamed protein product [Nyctereutes procyonoides]
MGFDPWSPGSRPGPKAGAKPLHHPGIPESGFRWRFYITECWSQGNRNWSSLISTTDCQPLGCQTSINFTFDRFYSLPPPGPNPSSDPIICFTYDQTHPNCQDYWVQTNGGCPYSYCSIHHLCQGPFTSPSTAHHPWDPRWAMGVTAKLYQWGYSSYPTASLQIYRSYIRVLQNQSTLKDQADTICTQEQLLQTHLQTNPTQDQDPFSWVKLIQQGTSLANLSGMGNLSHCFICVPPNSFVAIPFPNAFSLTSSAPTSPAPHLSFTDVPLFTDPLNHQFPFCYSIPNLSLCNVTQLNTTSHYAPIATSHYALIMVSFGAMARYLNLSIPLPPSSAEVALLTSPLEKQKQVIFLPLVVRVSLASTLVATGLGTGTLIHFIDSSRDLSEKLQMAVKASAESLVSLQRQITSVAQVALQNQRALDLLTAEKGGTCMFLNQDCCYYINETGVVETDLHTLAKVRESLQKQYYPVDPNTTQWWQTTLTTWLLHLLSPLLIIGILLMERIREISRVSANQLILHPYACLPTSDMPTTPLYQ